MSHDYPSRRCALKVLQSVFEDRQTLDHALRHTTEKYELSSQDAAFVHALCGFVLRYKPSLQGLVNKAANRKKDPDPIRLNLLLLIGAAQIHLMDVADHAAVDSTVTLADKPHKGLVNAVLRRLISEKGTSLRPSLPSWLYKTWEADYGDTIAKAIAKASAQTAPTGITHKNGDWRLAEGEIDLTPDEWVQDFASHMPVHLSGNVEGKRVFDLCAAPGGKTMQLAAAGAKITAVDLSEKRLERLRENLNRTQLSDNIEVVCADLLKWQPEGQADVVLLDAPCSATGTIRRHPDLPYIRTVKDIKSLVSLQYDLLNRAKKWVKAGGILMYCTCSLQKDEGERQVERFLQQNKGWKRALFPAINAQWKEWTTTEGDIRLLPTYGSMDGFFISILRAPS